MTGKTWRQTTGIKHLTLQGKYVILIIKEIDMLTWYIVVEDSSGNKVELRDVPKDVEVVVNEFIHDMEGN